MSYEDLDVFEGLIRRERDRQDIKWGEQNHEPLLWLAILGEEFGELSSAILNTVFNPTMQRSANMEEELVQVAAVCKAMWESGRRNGWL